MSGSNDWLGGYTLQELLGAPPVSKSKKQLKQEKKAGKRGFVSTVVGAPIRIVMGIVKLPVTVVSKLIGGIGGAIVEIVKLPMRLVGALASPWRKK